MRAEGLADCIRKKLGRVPGLHSLILYGSLVRGDFVPGTSDIDFFLVLEDESDEEKIIELIRPVLEECSSHLNPVEVGISWEFLPNLRDPLHLGYPYKFLTIYQDDFRVNHLVILGEDIVGILPEYPIEELVSKRVEVIMNNLERFSGNRKMLHLLAGETARLMAFLNGSSLRKNDVLRTIQEIGDENAVKVYQAYLRRRSEPFDEDFLRKFVENGVEKIKKLSAFYQSKQQRKSPGAGEQ